MLSVLEEIILSAIYRLKENAYGVTIRNKVSEVTHRDIIYGTLYNTLEQLVRKGYVHKDEVIRQGRGEDEAGCCTRSLKAGVQGFAGRQRAAEEDMAGPPGHDSGIRRWK